MFVLEQFGPSMLVLSLSLGTSSYPALLPPLFSYANFAYAACSTMFLALPADVFQSRAVASASGLGGTAAGVGTLTSTYLIGQVADRHSFEPVVLAASVIIPLVAVTVFITLVRASAQRDPRRLVLDF